MQRLFNIYLVFTIYKVFYQPGAKLIRELFNNLMKETRLLYSYQYFLEA